MADIKNSVNSFLKNQESCIGKISENVDSIAEIIQVLLDARDNKAMIVTMGNGGSASTASHFVSDLLKTSITENTNRFSALSLVDNIPVLLAWANDVSYNDVFTEQLKNFLKKDDIVIAFSGSGKSKNVVNALQYAKSIGAKCIGFTGMDGGDFPKLCNICHVVPSPDMLQIESTHLVLCHCIISTIRGLGKPQFTYE